MSVAHVYPVSSEIFPGRFWIFFRNQQNSVWLLFPWNISSRKCYIYSWHVRSWGPNNWSNWLLRKIIERSQCISSPEICITVKLSLLFCLFVCFFYDAITIHSRFTPAMAITFILKLLKLLVRIKPIKVTNETGRLKAHPQSQASKELCRIQTLRTCHQIEWNIYIYIYISVQLNGFQKSAQL